MTAQGVISSPLPAPRSVLPGFSTPEAPAKTGGNSFEDFMASSKGGKEKDIALASSGRKEPRTVSDNVSERAKELLSGEGKTKPAMVQNGETAENFEEAVEAVSTLMVQLRQVICETLGITEEQLTGAMEELGLTDADLLDRGSLQELFLNLNQVSEPTEFLTNEELFDDFSDLMKAVEQVFDASRITPEQCREVLKETGVLQQETEPVTEPEDVATETVKTPEAAKELPEETKEAEPEVSAEGADTKKAAVQTGEKTESDTAGEGQHTAAARERGTAKVISSGTDAEVRNVFIDALANAAAAGTGEEAAEAVSQIREIANQIMEQIKIVIRPEQTNMELQLNPEHLGRVHLTITEKEGMMTAQFTTQTETAKEAIESQMASLRESLQNQGIKVEAIEVTVSEFGFERDGNAKQNNEGESGRQRRRNAFRVEEADEAAPQMADFLRMGDSSVDYSA